MNKEMVTTLMGNRPFTAHHPPIKKGLISPVAGQGRSHDSCHWDAPSVHTSVVFTEEVNDTHMHVHTMHSLVD